MEVGCSRNPEGGRGHEDSEDIARASGDVPERGGLLETSPADALAAGLRVPALWSSQELPDRGSACGAVPGLSLPGLAHGRDRLPQDPGSPADLVPRDLLRGTPQEGHLGPAIPAGYGPGQLPDRLDAAAQAAFEPKAPGGV